MCRLFPSGLGHADSRNSSGLHSARSIFLRHLSADMTDGMVSKRSKSAYMVSIPLAMCVGVLSHQSAAVMGEELCAGLVSWLSKAESITWQSSHRRGCNNWQLEASLRVAFLHSTGACWLFVFSVWFYTQVLSLRSHVLCLERQIAAGIGESVTASICFRAK